MDHWKQPRHLAKDYAEQFADRSVARAYRTRPPYPPALFELLAQLVVDEPRVVLELGAGTGDLTLGLAPHVARIEAVEPAASMLEIARERTAALDTVDWVQTTAEEHVYRDEYALVVAAESFHWMDWALVSSKIARALTPHGMLALVQERRALDVPWAEELSALLKCYSTNQDYRPYDLIDELRHRGLFQELGRTSIVQRRFEQSVEHYVESFHSRNGFSLERMGKTADAFDRELSSLLSRFGAHASLTMAVATNVVWGRPSGAERDA